MNIAPFTYSAIRWIATTIMACCGMIEAEQTYKDYTNAKPQVINMTTPYFYSYPANGGTISIVR